ncbi:hypothetical protein [Virgibacillus salinus]|uniref:Uncharacterized protein n=1 Tax=Virgibacillus salinus TaxID=553311 RepID=A0A1H0XV66_9BACI|nr:hypothetical protein [Virgibacillus salinus]SDQ06773.1 hypothetical protein SAMN05216231_0231 [Virgibacillus salinus]
MANTKLVSMPNREVLEEEKQQRQINFIEAEDIHFHSKGIHFTGKYYGTDECGQGTYIKHSTTATFG